MSALAALDPLDLIMGIATIFGTYIAYKGYQLSEKEFKLNCIELGISTREAINRAGESYQQYQNDSLQEKNEALSEANEILTNDQDTVEQRMEQVYNNYSLNNSYANQYSQAVADDDSLYSMYRNLAKDTIYHRKLIKDTLAINDYTNYTRALNEAKNVDVRNQIKNIGTELKNTSKQESEAKKVVAESKKERKEVKNEISGKTQTANARPFVHPYF